MTRLNFTGRRRINRDNVRLRLTENEGVVVLHVDQIDLQALDLPDDATVIVEAYRQTNLLRVPCGTVGQLKPPSETALSEFEGAPGILFRVKVVGSTAPSEGKLLAAADRLPATLDDGPTGRVSILPFRPTGDLDQRLWQLDTDDEWPTVLINIGVGDWKSFAQSVHFRALVYPEVVRLVALWVVEHLEDAAEGDGAASVWRNFLANFGVDPVEAAPSGDDRYDWAREWAEDVADKFARKHKFFDLLQPVLEGVGAE